MKKPWLILGVTGLVAVLGWAWMRGGNSAPEVEYRYAPIEKGELVSSITATGQLVALTSVEVKSKAGGKIVQLRVEEGDIVRKGDVIAVIDPSDTQAVYDQAAADLSSAQARVTQARVNYELQVQNSQNAVSQAEAAVETARIRLERERLESQRQPELTKSALDSAKSQVNAARTALSRFESVTMPQERRSAANEVARTEADLNAARSDLTRQEQLLQQGYVAKSAVEQARSRFESAKAAHSNAKQRADTIETDLDSELANLREAVRRAEAGHAEANANRSQVDIAKRNLAEAEKSLETARIGLDQARDSLRNNTVRQQDISVAQASAVRSRVSVENAKVQLDSTTVVAPRDGVVTAKLLEEGAIIPPGQSAFSQGTGIVQLSDITRLFVECAVDEADIANVKPGQEVRLVVEAFPSGRLKGKVERISPAAKTDQNITAIKVRVEIDPGFKERLLPGMNATCEFITMAKPNVLIAPMQAIQREGEKTTIKVKAATGPVVREVKIGETGNNGMEILEGVKEGEEVVVAEINLKELRETQAKMLEAQQGGGLAGGMPNRNRNAISTGRGASGGGGGAPRGGGGGGGPR
ncbi:MAG: Multidrug resistance protein MdtA [Fimbriimonadaceae bacterium]|nr:Multidrug resistance protein MdtA [Fimbriimonadaceae bacterium]